MPCKDGPDITEVVDKTEWAAHKTSAARQCKTMVVGFFSGDSGDYGGIGTLLARLSAEYPMAWFYTVDVSSDAAQVVADRCQVHATPSVQIWQDSMLVETAETPTADELEDLLEKYGARW